MKPGRLLSWYLEVTRENRVGLGNGRERYVCQFFGDVQKDSDGRDKWRSFCGCTQLQARAHYREYRKCGGCVWTFAPTGTNAEAERAGTAVRAGGQDVLSLLVVPEGEGFASAAWT